MKGAKPGEQRGGRARGAKNKCTIQRERLETLVLAQYENEKALAKDQIAEIAASFAVIARALKPRRITVFPEPDPEGSGANGNGANGARNSARVITPYLEQRLDLYYKYANAAVAGYSKAVSYQSPSLRALVVGLEKTADQRSLPSAEILDSSWMRWWIAAF